MDSARTRRPVISAALLSLPLAVWFGLLQRPAAAAQSWSQSQQAVDSCERELSFRMGLESRGRDPQATLDYRTLEVRQQGQSTVSVRGKGQFRRDRFDSARAFTSDCTFDAREGRAQVNYRWSGGWGGDYDSPGYGTPPAYKPSGSGGTSSYPPSGRVFHTGGIINRASGKGLDVKEESTRDTANVQQWDFGGKPNQTWDVVDLGGGQFSIINQGSGKALDVANHNAADGANVQQYRWHNGDNQRWRLERAGGGFYRIVSVSSGKCLDADLGRINENGANVQQWSCSGQPNQQWKLGGR